MGSSTAIDLAEQSQSHSMDDEAFTIRYATYIFIIYLYYLFSNRANGNLNFIENSCLLKL